MNTLSETPASAFGAARQRQGRRWLAALLVALGLAGLTTIWQQERTRSAQRALTEQRARAEAEWGVHVERLSLSAGGYMLDFRYRVTDAAKASPLLDPRAKSSVIPEGKEARLEVPQTPTVGTLKQSTRHVQNGQVYFALFANPAKLVRAGDRVTVAIGDFKVAGVTVE